VTPLGLNQPKDNDEQVPPGRTGPGYLHGQPVSGGVHGRDHRRRPAHDQSRRLQPERVRGRVFAEPGQCGHGYKGEIASLANYNQPGVNISGLGHRNVTTIEFMPQ